LLEGKEVGGQIAQNRSKSDDKSVDSVRIQDFFNAGLSPHSPQQHNYITLWYLLSEGIFIIDEDVLIMSRFFLFVLDVLSILLKE